MCRGLTWGYEGRCSRYTPYLREPVERPPISSLISWSAFLWLRKSFRYMKVIILVALNCNSKDMGEIQQN